MEGMDGSYSLTLKDSHSSSTTEKKETAEAEATAARNTANTLSLICKNIEDVSFFFHLQTLMGLDYNKKSFWFFLSGRILLTWFGHLVGHLK